VPLLSWVLLRAKCRECRMPISWRYPAVELAVGVWFAQEGAVWWHLVVAKGLWAPLTATYEASVAVTTVGSAALGFLLIGLLVMDWQTHTLPDAFTLAGTGIGFVLVCVQSAFLGPHENELLLQGRNPLTSPGNVTDRGNVILTGPEHLILGRLLAIVAAAGLVLLIRWLYWKARRREGLGLGDAKLMALIAAFLGFWPAMLALMLGVVLCSGYAAVLIVRGKATAATRLPLGSFLCVGGLVAALAGTEILAWYSTLL
jgi:leader peptidase (prepilin peptidase)/N-methyltransferase